MNRLNDISHIIYYLLQWKLLKNQKKVSSDGNELHGMLLFHILFSNRNVQTSKFPKCIAPSKMV